MKQTVSTLLLICGAVFGVGYFVLLTVLSPSVFGFSYVWLCGGLVCLYALYRRRTHTPVRVKPPVQKAVCIAAVLCAAVSAGALYRICTPVTDTGTHGVPYLIVLGGGVHPDGTLGDVPLERLKTAAGYLEQHPDTKGIVSGGQGTFAPCAESQVLFQNLVELGIAPGRIIEENRARDTIQNFIFSAELIAQDIGCSLAEALTVPVTVVTSDFHLARSEELARRLGFTAVYGIQSRTPLPFVLNVYAREICSWCKLYLRLLLTGKPAPLGTVAAAVPADDAVAAVPGDTAAVPAFSD